MLEQYQLTLEQDYMDRLRPEEVPDHKLLLEQMKDQGVKALPDALRPEARVLTPHHAVARTPCVVASEVRARETCQLCVKRLARIPYVAVCEVRVLAICQLCANRPARIRCVAVYEVPAPQTYRLCVSHVPPDLIRRNLLWDP